MKPTAPPISHVTSSDQTSDARRVGWREWVGLPALGLPLIKAKVDTGARTSALHAANVERSGDRVVLQMHPLQRNTDLLVTCEAEIIDERVVRDSGGHEEPRLVIATDLVIAGKARRIEVTLTNRENMGFRMLLGRTAMRGLVVDPRASYLTQPPPEPAALKAAYPAYRLDAS